MLLIVAQPNDETVSRFTTYLREVQVDFVITKNWLDIDLSIKVECNKELGIEIYASPERRPIRGIMNRYAISNSPEKSDEEKFINSESLASWWSILGCFHGPVLNRPTRWGFTPNIDRLSLAKSVAQIESPLGTIVTFPFNDQRVGTVNIHRLRDGGFVGRMGNEDLALDESELYVLTRFDLLQTRHILFAGSQVFDLSQSSGQISPEVEQQLSPLVNEMRHRQATFCMAVVGHTPSSFHVLHTTAFPAVSQYHHLERKVHKSLVDYLLA